MKKCLLVLLGLILSSSVWALDPVNPDANAKAREVLNYLASIYQQKTLMGYNVYVHTPDLYEQTGRHGAVWSDDLEWASVASMGNLAQEALNKRYLLSLHWHWGFNGESAWKGDRVHPVDVAAMVTPGTPEHTQAMIELAGAADKLQVLRDAGVPVLFRPLHEIDGGWFWWTDTANPANTAALYRMIFDYMVKVRHLDNLLWVYNAATDTGQTLAFRQAFYPGAQYADISSIDIYGIDYRNAIGEYNTYFDTMTQVAPGKLQALGECDAVPDPDKMAAGQTPKWLYALPWWGTPNGGHPLDWALKEVSHDALLTLDELPYLGSGNIEPQVGILSPQDDGSGHFNATAPVISAYAIARGSTVQRVEFYANGSLVGTVSQAPYTFTWSGATPGSYAMTAKAVAANGLSSTSNTVRITYGVADLAYKQPVVASSGTGGEAIVDGDLYSTWTSDNTVTTPEDQWVYVDLGGVFTINQVNSFWGWKIHPADYSIDVALSNPGTAASWTTVRTVTGSPWGVWKTAFRDTFTPVAARYVRIHMTLRASGQTWGGYNLAALEVPVSLAAFGSNDAPVISLAASAAPSDIWEYKTQLSVAGIDADRETLSTTWSVLAGPSTNVVFSPNGTVFAAQSTATFTVPGNYTLRATVADGRGGNATSDVAVVVNSVKGAVLRDDRSSQSGNGQGAVDVLSMWNRFGMRFLLERGNVAHATLRVYRLASDTAPIAANLYKGSTDNWNEVNGPVPDQSDFIGAVPSAKGGMWLEFDVTDFVAQEARGDAIASFVLTNDQGSWNTQVHTRQNAANPPELTVVFAQTQTISFAPLADRSLDSGAVTLSATASSGLAVQFSSQTASVCTVSGNTVTLLAVGTCAVAADQPGNGTYGPASTVTQQFNVLGGAVSASGDVPLPGWAIALLGAGLLGAVRRRSAR